MALQQAKKSENGRIGSWCPPIEDAVILWDDPWPQRQITMAKQIARRRRDKGGRSQHDAPLLMRLRTSIKYALPIILFGCLIVAAIGFNRWTRTLNAPIQGSIDNFMQPQHDTIYDGVAPGGQMSPTPPPIPTHIPLSSTPTATVFIMPSTDNDNSMAPPYESVRETLTATYAPQ